MRNLLLRHGLLLTAALPLATALAGPGSASPTSAGPAAAETVEVDSSVRRSPAQRPGADLWARLRHCESSGRYDRNTGNGYYGAYQFKPSTWRSLGYTGLPHQAPPAVQHQAALRLQARDGWGQWPACARRIGVRR